MKKKIDNRKTFKSLCDLLSKMTIVKKQVGLFDVVEAVNIVMNWYGGCINTIKRDNNVEVSLNYTESKIKVTFSINSHFKTEELFIEWVHQYRTVKTMVIAYRYGQWVMIDLTDEKVCEQFYQVREIEKTGTLKIKAFNFAHQTVIAA